MTPILGIMAASTKRDNWLALYDGFTNTNMFGIAVDSSNNIYSSGSTTVTYASGILTKMNSFGANQFAHTISASSINVSLREVAVDSAGNIYVIGYARSPRVSFIAKYNSSAVLQWQRKLTVGTLDSSYMAIGIDASSNVYAIGFYYPTGQTYDNGMIVKYNSSGTLQWQKTLNYADYVETYYGTADSSGNVYAFGWSTQGTVPKGVMVKLDTSGTLVWQKEITDSSSIQDLTGQVDSSGNVYTLCSGIGTVSGLMISKYNSSGTLQWQRKLAPSSGPQNIQHNCVIDSSGNIYVVGRNGTSGIIVKYNSSGTIQWQRSITPSVRDISLDSTQNFILLTGQYNNSVFNAKLPVDGSKTGTYIVNGISIVYAATTFTDTAAATTVSTGNLTIGTGAGTDAVESLTDASTTLTEYVVGV